MLLAIGAGVGRTGTRSLQSALQTLVGGKCYHMFELGNRSQDLEVWQKAARGDMPDWNQFLSGWSAAVDWPASAYWKEISDSFPEALIILSSRDPNEWWNSASQTIFKVLADAKKSHWRDMVFEMLEKKFTTDLANKEKCITAYEKHNLNVRQNADPKRLLDWHPKDGWDPICEFLNLPAPYERFPHLNDLETFKKKIFISKG